MKNFYLIIICTGVLGMNSIFCQGFQTVLSPVKPSLKSLSPLERAMQDPRMVKVQPTYWVHDSSWYSQWMTTSSSWLLSEREFLSYNGSGSMIQDLYLVLNTSQQWENFNRTLNTYGASGNTISSTGQTWNNVAHLWVDFMYTHFDAMGRTDTSWYKQFDHVNNVFLFGNRNIYSYNTSNLMTEMLGQNLDSATGNWINSIKITNAYNSSNLQAEQLTLIWSISQNTWVNNQKYEYNYDAGNYPTGYLFSIWDTITNQWVPNTQATYTNSTSGLPLIKLYLHWQTGTSTWQNFEQITNQYNSNNLLTDVLDELWNSGTSAWINNWKDQYVYYSSNVQKTRHQYYWNPNGSSWMETYYSLNDSTGYNLELYSKTIDFQNYTYVFGDRYLYFYNNLHNCTEYEHFSLDIPSGNWSPSGRRQFTYDQNGNNTVQLDQVWDSGSSSYINYYMIENFFSTTTGISEKKDISGYCLFANPIQKGKPIVCPGLKEGQEYNVDLYNLNGQLVFSSRIHSREHFILPENIAPGLYMLSLWQVNKLIVTGKVIVAD